MFSMYAKSKRWTYAVIATLICLVAILAPIIATSFLSKAEKNHQLYSNLRFNGISTTFDSSQTLDDSLTKYINLTSNLVTGQGGPGYSWTTIYTNLTWIGSPKDSVKNIQNINLVAYSRLDENDSYGNGTGMLIIGLHVIASQTEPTIPNDAIDYKEITIPSLGVDSPSFSYTFNCSTYVA